MSDRNPVTDNCGLRGVRSCEECFSLNDFDGDGIVDSFDADADGDGRADPDGFVPGIIKTGLSGTAAGGGCALVADGERFDPQLLLLMMAAIGFVGRRRRAATNRIRRVKGS